MGVGTGGARGGVAPPLFGAVAPPLRPDRPKIDENCIVSSLKSHFRALASGGCAPRPLHRCKDPYLHTVIALNCEILVPKLTILVTKSFFLKSELTLDCSSSGGLRPQTPAQM